MIKLINIQSLIPINTADGLPKQLEKDWIPGYHTNNISGEFGDLGIQWIEIKGIASYYITGELYGLIRFRLAGNTSTVFITILFQGEIDVVYKTQIHQLKKNDRFSILYFPDDTAEVAPAALAESTSFGVLIIAFPVAVIQTILLPFPWLHDLNGALNSQSALADIDKPLSAFLSDKVYDLIHTPFAPSIEEYVYRLLRELATGIFESYITNGEEKVLFNFNDISCIHEAKDYIDNHLLERITIKQLARKVGINQLKLKKGFKSVYGSGVHGYHVQQRLTIAKKALEKTTKPIYQIARQAGYSATPNFSAAFKKFFGITPYHHRRNIRNQ